MATRILLVRHGETAWNREEVFRGRADVPLNEVGRAQARALAAATKDRELAAVYSSPLSRAVETAQALAGVRGLAVEPIAAFTDIDFGHWQGRSRLEIQEEAAELYRQWLETPHRVMFPGGESLADVRDRAVPALVDLARRHDGQSVAVVTHRVVSKVILCEALNIGLSGFWRIVQSNACLNVLSWEDGAFRVQCLNDTCHLERTGAGVLAADF